jgi:hypothetical protein
MMQPFPIEAELHDAIVCASCGHPIWDLRVNETCAECESREHAQACSLFLLNDFTATDGAISADAPKPSSRA